MLQDGETALFRAALRGRVKIVKMLVDYGAAVDVRDKVTVVIIEHDYIHGSIFHVIQ